MACSWMQLSNMQSRSVHIACCDMTCEFFFGIVEEKMPPKKSKPKKGLNTDNKQKHEPTTKFESKVDKELEILLKSVEGEMGEGIDGSMTEFSVHQIADAMHLSSEDTVLDIGSSCGRACVFLACNIYCQVIGLEFNANTHNSAMQVHRLMVSRYPHRSKAPPILPVFGDFRKRGLEIAKNATAMYTFWEAQSWLKDYSYMNMADIARAGYSLNTFEKMNQGIGTLETFLKSPNVRCIALVGYKLTNREAEPTMARLVAKEFQCEQKQAEELTGQLFEFEYVDGRNGNPKMFSQFKSPSKYTCMIITRKMQKEHKPSTKQLEWLASKECRQYVKISEDGEKLQIHTDKEHAEFMSDLPESDKMHDDEGVTYDTQGPDENIKPSTRRYIESDSDGSDEDIKPSRFSRRYIESDSDGSDEEVSFDEDIKPSKSSRKLDSESVTSHVTFNPASGSKHTRWHSNSHIKWDDAEVSHSLQFGNVLHGKVLKHLQNAMANLQQGMK